MSAPPVPLDELAVEELAVVLDELLAVLDPPVAGLPPEPPVLLVDGPADELVEVDDCALVALDVEVLVELLVPPVPVSSESFGKQLATMVPVRPASRTARRR